MKWMSWTLPLMVAGFVGAASAEDSVPSLSQPFSSSQEKLESLADIVDHLVPVEIHGGNPSYESFRLSTNVSIKDFTEIQGFFRTKMRAKTDVPLSFWILSSPMNRHPDVLVGAVQFVGDANLKDPNTHFWYLKRTRESYHIIPVGKFLMGDFQGEALIGSHSGPLFFIRSYSCTECEPDTRLSVLICDEKSNAVKHWQFDYSEKPNSPTYDPYLTFDVALDDDGPKNNTTTKYHRGAPDGAIEFIQHYVEQGKPEDEEWWDFKCHGLNCIGTKFDHNLPKALKPIWAAGTKI